MLPLVDVIQSPSEKEDDQMTAPVVNLLLLIGSQAGEAIVPAQKAELAPGLDAP